MASICNDERASLGVMSGHERKTLRRSVGDALLTRFAREIEAISRRQEAAVVLIVGDDRVRQVVQPERGHSGLGNITLTSAPGARLDLPEDLLAVLGWDWPRLVSGTADGAVRRPISGADAGLGPCPSPGRWTSKLRLRGGRPRRTHQAERALDRVAHHLVQALSKAPARFHDHHRLARWGVVLRRLIPTLTALLLIGTALRLPRLTDSRNSGLWMALHHVPIALLGLSFRLQELPRFEIPRWPRRSTAAHWGVPPEAPARQG